MTELLKHIDATTPNPSWLRHFCFLKWILRWNVWDASTMATAAAHVSLPIEKMADIAEHWDDAATPIQEGPNG